ncbi:hypothetical protein [Natronoglomus mannanivorans]|uniref:Uncharacterized protein n=1 Tax=Natronoglomus mannanivorans TaxID=2979990 RepID=A0AAP2Z1T9_9EURY|nr:hypothetical protein [Halobacteria archaeon AArc-xg1-1]
MHRLLLVCFLLDVDTLSIKKRIFSVRERWLPKFLWIDTATTQELLERR